MVLTPTYHVFEMYKVYQDATLLPIELRCGEYSYDQFSMPLRDAWASRDEQGRVHVSICNVDPNQPAELTLAVQGMAPTTATGRVLTADRITAHNTFDAPELVRPTELQGISRQQGQVNITLPARSVTMLELL